MKGKKKRLLISGVLLCLLGVGIIWVISRSGKEEKDLPAYIIIKEELDVNRTADKVSEIMQYTPEKEKESENY